MITSLQLKNFKAWKDTGKVSLAPLTIVFGGNSAGKSSLGHLLLALKQTVISTDRKRALHLGDANSLIDLGTFKDCLHGHSLDKPLEFSLRWKLEKSIEIVNPKNKGERFIGEEIELSVTIGADKNEQPTIQAFTYQLFKGGVETLDISLSTNSANEFQLLSKAYKLTKVVGRKWPLEPEKFYRVSESSVARFQNADFLVDLALKVERMLGNLYYLGPLRENPRRIYPWSGETPEDVGHNGGLAVSAILAAMQQDRKLNRGPKKATKDFPVFIAEWLKDLGIIQSFVVSPVAAGRKEYEVLVKSSSASPVVKLTDVGIGVSQVLPAIVQAFYAPSNSIVWMEQPELHLHPQAQSELADVFASAIKSRQDGKDRNVQFIIESHSEHFLNRLMRRVAEGDLSPQDVAVYFCRPTSDGTCLDRLEVDDEGSISNWPENFFGDEMKDALARTEAAMQRRASRNPS